MPLSSLDDNQRRQIARRHLDTAEHWLRRLIHHRLRPEFGVRYLSEGPWGNKLKRRVADLAAARPSAREVDATTWEDLIKIVCFQGYWGARFAAPLRGAFPEGASSARHYLGRLRDIRNKINHAGGCSVRELEQAICYSNDLAAALQAYFRQAGLAKDFNVPMIVRYVDNLGNESTLEGISQDINSRAIDWRSNGAGDLRPGQILLAEVDVDSSFAESDYRVNWSVFGFLSTPGRRAEIPIELQHVGEQFAITFEVVSNKAWHRQFGVDDRLVLIFRVLPPIDNG